jgi:protein phosphatase 2C family protein 2/3
MGQNLSEPVTNKVTSSQRDDQLYVGSSSMQGWRINMEDAHTHLLRTGPPEAECSFFAVYDGHGGSAVAEYAGLMLHKRFLERPEYLANDIPSALINCVLAFDAKMLAEPEIRDQMSGSTAIIVVLKNNHLYIANLGEMQRNQACQT